MSDIKLDGDNVIVEGTTTLFRTYDLYIDAQSRRSNQNGSRRALVHNSQDGLTINYNGDYPGGVTIYGKVATPNALTVGSLEVGSTLGQLLLRASNLEVTVKTQATQITEMTTRIGKMESLLKAQAQKLAELEAKSGPKPLGPQ